MNTHRYLKPAIVAAALAIALPAAAQSGFRDDDSDNGVRYDTARVVRVDAIVNHASAPISRETCWQEPNTYRYNPSYTYYRDDGDGPEAVTVGGNYQQVREAQQHCRTTTNWRDSDRIMGYDVTYRYNGREYTTHMDHDPGPSLQVRVNYDYSVSPEDGDDD